MRGTGCSNAGTSGTAGEGAPQGPLLPSPIFRLLQKPTCRKKHCRRECASFRSSEPDQARCSRGRETTGSPPQTGDTDWAILTFSSRGRRLREASRLSQTMSKSSVESLASSSRIGWLTEPHGPDHSRQKCPDVSFRLRRGAQFAGDQATGILAVGFEFQGIRAENSRSHRHKTVPRKTCEPSGTVCFSRPDRAIWKPRNYSTAPSCLYHAHPHGKVRCHQSPYGPAKLNRTAA